MDRFDDDQALSVNEILDLMDRLRPHVAFEARSLRAVLEWGAERQLFTWAAPVERIEIAVGPKEMRDLIFDPPAPFPPRATAEKMSAAMAQLRDDENPAGPQASSGKPDPKAAGDLNAVAARPECEVKAPMGAEAVIPAADDAPATPVAGGVASKRARGAGQSPLWTEEEDERAIAMRLAGHSATEIAEALGRPLQGTQYRLYHQLKARIAAALAVGAGSSAGQSEPAADAEEQAVSSGEDPAEDPAGAVDSTAETVAVAPADAPLWDAIWWREANANLNALSWRRPFNAATDLSIAEGIVERGLGIAKISADLGLDSRQVKDRWTALKSCAPKGSTRTDLLAVLRHRSGSNGETAREATE